MGKAKEKEFNVAREWNDFVWSLIQAEGSWKKLSGHFLKSGGIDSVSEEWSQYIVRVCRTTKFRYAIEDFLRFCGIRGDIKDYLIKIKKGD